MPDFHRKEITVRKREEVTKEFNERFPASVEVDTRNKSFRNRLFLEVLLDIRDLLEAGGMGSSSALEAYRREKVRELKRENDKKE